MSPPFTLCCTLWTSFLGCHRQHKASELRLGLRGFASVSTLYDFPDELRLFSVSSMNADMALDLPSNTPGEFSNML